MDGSLTMSLIGSGAGTILALAICRLFDWVRRTIPEPVAVGGVVFAVMVGFVGLFLSGIYMIALLFFPALVFTGFVRCQQNDPAKKALASFSLFGILIVEFLFMGLVVCAILAANPFYAPASEISRNTIAALLLVVALEESIGHRRRRMTLR